MYKSLATLLHLPSYRWVKELKRRACGVIDGMNDGPRHMMIRTWFKHAKEAHPGDASALELIVSDDGMKMRQQCILSREKATKDKFIGADLSEGEGALEALYRQYVQDLQTSASGGNDMSDMQEIANKIEYNTEHVVFYARSLKPGIDLCFIASAFNIKSCTAGAVSTQLHRTTIALHVAGFRVRVKVCDSATSNISVKQRICALKAKEFIPSNVLEKHGLEGDFGVAYNGLDKKKPIFWIDDPPHVLKRVVSALSNRTMTYDNLPLSMKMLSDVWETIETSVSSTALQQSTRLTRSHFNHDSFSIMNVRKCAQVLSNSMVQLIDRFCKEPEKYPSKMVPSNSNARAHVYIKLQDLVKYMNRLFDICNSKDPKNPIVKLDKSTGPQYVDEMLEILRFFEKWKQWVDEQPGFSEKDFLPIQTLNSLRSICYGFSSMIYHFCMKNKQCLTLCRVNQDVNEHHYGNVRASSGSHDNPNQMQCMVAVNTSHIIRLEKVTRGNCGALGQGRTNLPIGMLIQGTDNTVPTKRQKETIDSRVSLKKQRATFKFRDNN